MKPLLRAASAAVLLGSVTTVLGATRYVTDELRINLRTGAGNQYRITEVLTTGVRLETLQSRGDWTQVRTQGGETGWVRTQYLAEEPAAADRLESLLANRTAAEERVATLEQELEQVRTELGNARERIDELASTNEELDLKLSEAERGLQLAEENKRLKKQVIDLERGIQDLENETARLADRNRQDWFLVGAAVMFVGIVFGMLATRIRWRRRSSWSEL